jgi:acetylornithine deacetylase
VADASALVRIPSVTGDERAVIDAFGQLARSRGLVAQTRVHDLATLRADPDYPGEEAKRSELFGAVAMLRGRDPSAPRLCMNGHLDTVAPWSSRDALSGEVVDGELRGRGSVDMKGPVVAALHALAAVAAAGGTDGDVVLQAVASEEDGGLGTFAALREDADFAACLIPEPTGFELACAQAGALTFTGEISGVAAHAALRLKGVSAVERFVDVHSAILDLERDLNRDVAHPLMRKLPLPYPISVGRLESGTWSSSVPDKLVFEGRIGVPVGARPKDIMERFERFVTAASPDVRVEWTGGRFSPGETDPEHPFVRLVAGAAGDELGAEPAAVGVPYGADMRLFCERGIPCVMFGTPGLERAHTVDEFVRVDELVTLARALIRVVARF